MYNKWFSFINGDELSELAFNPVVNNDMALLNKPDGGLWASSYIDTDDIKSIWHLWCINNYKAPIKENGVVFSLKDNAKVLIINSREDYVKCVKKYKLTSNDLLNKVTLDYKMIAKDYDAFYLTEDGLYDTTYNPFKTETPDKKDVLNFIDFRNHFERSLLDNCFMGWDVSSIILFNLDCIDIIEYIKIKKYN